MGKAWALGQRRAWDVMAGGKGEHQSCPKGYSSPSALLGALHSLLPLHPPPCKAQILPMLQNRCPHTEKETLFLSWECFFPKQPGRKGEESVSTAEACEAGTAGGARCTTQFARCLSTPLSKVSPSRSFQIPLARILGIGPRE